MAVAFGSASNTSWANRTNTVVTPPTGIANGHLLLYFLVLGATTGITGPTPPAGFSVIPLDPSLPWPLVVTDGSYQMAAYGWYKVASGESGSYTATHLTYDSQGVMVRLTGQHPTTPWPVNGQVTLHRAPGGPADDQDLWSYPSITTTVDGQMVVAFGWDWGDSGNDLTPPTGGTVTMTERVDVAPLVYISTGIKSPAGATGVMTQQNNASASSPWGAVTMAVAPSTGPPPADLSGTASGTGGTSGNVTVSSSRAGPSLVNTSAQMTSLGNRQSIKQHNEAAGGIPWLPTVLPGDKLFTSAQTSSTGAQGVGQAGIMVVNTSAQMTSTGITKRLGSSVVTARGIVTFKPSGTKDAPFLNPPTDAIIELYTSDALIED